MKHTGHVVRQVRVREQGNDRADFRGVLIRWCTASDSVVQASEALDDRLNGRLGLGTIANVGGHGEGVTAGFLDLCREGFKSVLTACDQGDGCAPCASAKAVA